MLVPRLPVLLAVALLFVLTCSLGFVDAKPDAESLAAEHFASRMSGDLEETLSLYGDVFFQVTPRSEWRDTLAMIDWKLGRPEDRSLSGWNVFFGAQGAGPGTYVTLEYDVVYPNYPAHETLRIFTPAWGWPTTIVGHHVDSPAFLDP